MPGQEVYNHNTVSIKAKAFLVANVDITLAKDYDKEQLKSYRSNEERRTTMTDFGFTEDDISQRINDMKQRVATLRAKGVQVNTGYSAIQPYLDTIPAFTEYDVRHYVLSHNQSIGDITNVGEPTLERIVYTTSKEASETLHCFISFEEEQKVFYAELSGTFLFFGGPQPGTKATFHTHFIIFDAQTGNILASRYCS